jgi:hypothetical protein
MAATVGKVDPFEDGDDSASYHERLLMVFMANDIPSSGEKIKVFKAYC